MRERESERESAREQESERERERESERERAHLAFEGGEDGEPVLRGNNNVLRTYT